MTVRCSKSHSRLYTPLIPLPSFCFSFLFHSASYSPMIVARTKSICLYYGATGHDGTPTGFVGVQHSKDAAMRQGPLLPQSAQDVADRLKSMKKIRSGLAVRVSV